MNRAAHSAFSTFETVIVLVIIALLLLIAIPQFTRPSVAAVTAPDSVVAPSATGPIAVRVMSRGASQSGVMVRFEAEGKGRVVPAEATTDSAGVARSTWTAAADTGELVVTVRAGGRAAPALVLRSRVRGASSSGSPPAAHP